MTMQTGDVLGPYRIGERLGAGAMGEVYQALDQRLGREVAIKALPEALVGNAERVARFHREARALAALNHPGIATLYSFDELAGRFYLVMELVPGKTLRERVEQPLPLREAVDLARQLAEALEAAHEAGIVHRDLKPDNIKVTPSGRLKILDFGLMKRLALVSEPAGPSAVSLTAAGVAVGTLNYMSPEQLSGATIDSRVDVWAFGCVLFEMLTATRAFAGVEGEPWSALFAILHRDPPWERLPPGLPSAIERLVRQCLEKDPERRPQGLSAARGALERAVDEPVGLGAGTAAGLAHDATESKAPTIAFPPAGLSRATTMAPEAAPRAALRSRSSVSGSAALRVRRVEIGVAFAVLALLAGLWGIQLHYAKQRARTTIGITTGPDGVILAVEENGPAARAGLRAGDVIAGVGGHDVEGWQEYRIAVGALVDQPSWPIAVRRGGQRIDTAVQPGMRMDYLAFAADTWVSAFYWLVGLIALWRAPAFFRARMLFFYCALISLEFVLPETSGQLALVIAAVWCIVTGLQAAVELHLVALIPKAPAFLRRNPRWLILIYVVCAGAGVLGAATVAAQAFDWTWWPLSDEAYEWWVVEVGFAVWAAVELAWLAYRVATFPQRFGREQAALVLLGTVPWALSTWVSLGYNLRGVVDPPWLVTADPYLLTVWPIAVLVAIERETRRRSRLALAVVSSADPSRSAPELVAQIGGEMERTFGAERAAIYLRADSGRALVQMYGLQRGEHRLEPTSVLLHVLETSPDEQEVEDLLRQPLPEEERNWLAASGARLVVPAINSEGELAGLLAIGEKSSGEPYTASDRDALHDLARQLAWVHDNRQLRLRADEHRRVEQEVLGPLRRDRLNLARTCTVCGRCYDQDRERCERDDGELTIVVPVERLVDGRYRLERLIGRGGMGAVFEASDESLRRKVAVKVLTGRMFGDPMALKRFEREARVAARLHHPCVVSVHDYGLLEAGGAYLVMELLTGESFDHVLEGGQRVPAARLADWLDQACDGLQAAHSVHVVHRDLKPANLFVTRLQAGGSLMKLLDFGLAKLRGDGGAPTISLTAPGAVIGTIAYMAPEQLRGGEADERSDLYSLAVVAVEALTGQRPFAPLAGPQLNAAILHQEYRLPEPWSASAPLRRAVERCLAKDPAARFATVQELREHLVTAIRGAA